MNSNNKLPAWMSKTKPGKRTSEYTAKPKKKQSSNGNTTSGGMVKSGKRKAYLDSL